MEAAQLPVQFPFSVHRIFIPGSFLIDHHHFLRINNFSIHN
jgi:hypothetical protein